MSNRQHFFSKCDRKRYLRAPYKESDIGLLLASAMSHSARRMSKIYLLLLRLFLEMIE